jgi:hypothetical protein
MLTKRGVVSDVGVAAAGAGVAAVGAGAAAAGAGAGAAGAGGGAAGGGEVWAEAAAAIVTTAANPRTSFRIKILPLTSLEKTYRLFATLGRAATYHLSGKWFNGPAPAPAFSRSAPAMAALT